jgi:small subunit ribosomal protein S4e
MARGPKKHMKRIAAPKSWMVSKLGGIWVTRSSQGPHKLRESIPLSIVLRNRLKLALNARDVTSIL